MEKINIAGVWVSKINMEQAVGQICTVLDQPVGDLYHVVTPNPEMVLMAQSNFSFRDVLNNANIAVPDGVGLQMAADFIASEVKGSQIIRFGNLLLNGMKVGIKVFTRSKYELLPDRVAGSDLLPKILKTRPNTRVYFLGGGPNVAKLAGQYLKEKYPNMIISGIGEGGKINNDGFGLDDKETIERVSKSNTDLLVVCFGAPKQDLWINNHRDRLRVKVAIGLGGTLDYIAGVRVRPPKCLANHGLEWIWRLLQEPSRLGRIVNATIKFPWLIARCKFDMVQS